MPADVIIEVAAGVLRAIGHFFVDFVLQLFFEVAIQGVGYLICKPFKADVDADGWLATSVGFLFWVLLGLSVYFGYGRLYAPGTL